MEKNDLQKRKLKKLFKDLINTNISIMEFYRDLTDDPKSQKVCRDSIRQSKRALKIIGEVNHVEILTSLYNTFVLNKETYFVTISGVICAKVKKWDTTKFDEFIRLEEEAKVKSQEEYEEKEKQRKLIEQAKKDGKKVEMVLKDGKIVPVIIDQPKN